ncbi:MAG: hypothetical protein ACXWC9_09780 [Pseudobdellovibrionaceae bacterium]
MNLIVVYLVLGLLHSLPVYAETALANDPFESYKCDGSALDSKEVIAAIAPGEESLNLGTYSFIGRSRSCNSFTGCGSWEEASKDILKKSGRYIGTFHEASGNVNISFSNSTTWCSYELGASNFNCPLSGQIADLQDYTFEPTVIKKDCVSFRGSGKKYESSESSNYIETEILFIGQHTLFRQPFTPQSDGQIHVMPMTCVQSEYKSAGQCSTDYGMISNHVRSYLQFHITNGKFRVLSWSFYRPPEIQECELVQGTCELPFSLSSAIESKFQVVASGNQVSVTTYDILVGESNDPTCNYIADTESCHGSLFFEE